jgi:citrate lyase subunit beta/citryl-CoA lyase
VRVNAPGTPWHEDDLRLAAERRIPVVLPKAEDPDVVAASSRHWQARPWWR